MTSRLRIRHVTHFSYDEPAYESHNEVRLRPRDGTAQRTIGFRLETTPEADVTDYLDAFGNTVHAVSVHEPHRKLVVSADSIVECAEMPDVVPGPGTFTEFLADDTLRSQEQYDFLHHSRYVPFSPALKKFFWMARPRLDEPVAAYVVRMVAFVYGQFSYEPGLTNVHSDIDEILTIGAGVCQDFAHLTIGVLRLAGVPARYVSGYLAPRLEPEREPLGEQASHAWIEAMLPVVGWIGFDPTHGRQVTARHVRLAVGRDYGDVPPLRGVYRSSGRNQTMRVSLKFSENEVDDIPPPFDPFDSNQQ